MIIQESGELFQKWGKAITQAHMHLQQQFFVELQKLSNTTELGKVIIIRLYSNCKEHHNQKERKKENRELTIP